MNEKKIKTKNIILKLEKCRKIKGDIIKDIRIIFRLEKETSKEKQNKTIKDVRNPFKIKKRNNQRK